MRRSTRRRRARSMIRRRAIAKAHGVTAAPAYEGPTRPVHLQERLLHQVLRSAVVAGGFAQEAEQTRRNRIVDFGERGVITVGVALHGRVRAVNGSIRTTSARRTGCGGGDCPQGVSGIPPPHGPKGRKEAGKEPCRFGKRCGKDSCGRGPGRPTERSAGRRADCAPRGNTASRSSSLQPSTPGIPPTQDTKRDAQGFSVRERKLPARSRSI